MRPAWNHSLPEKVSSYYEFHVCMHLHLYKVRGGVSALLFVMNLADFICMKMRNGCGRRCGSTFFCFFVFVHLFLFICFFGKRVLSIFTSTHFSHQLFSNFYENDERAMLFERKSVIVCKHLKRKEIWMCCSCVLVHCLFFLCVETHTRNCNLHLNRVNKYTCWIFELIIFAHRL